MSRLSAARERLEKAIDRLEKVVENGGGDGQLDLEFATLKAHYDKLSKAASQVDAKLDKTIGQIESALGG